MVGVIARKELTDMLRDGRLRWAAAVVFTLLLASTAVGWRHYRDVRGQHESAQRAMRGFWLAQGEKNPHSAAHYGVWAFKPRTPLSFVDRGVDPYVGVAAWLEAHRQNEFSYRPAMDATAVQRFGEWTAAAVLQLLIPLLIIVLAFPAFAGEREQGTLRQLASLGVPPRALALLLVPAALLGAAALTLTGSAAEYAASAPRIAPMALAYLAYFAVIVGVALVVSARAPSARVALLALLGFWMLNSLVAPRVMTDAARRVAPTPSAFAFQAAVDRDLTRGIDGHSPDERSAMLLRATLARYGVSRAEELPINFDGVRLQAGEEHANDVFDAHYGALYARYHRQNLVHQAGAVVAPLLAVRSLSMGLAGTDVGQHEAFAGAAEDYRRTLQREMNVDLARNSRTGDVGYKAGPELWARVPEFTYTAPGLGAVLAAHRWSALLLVAWVAAAGALLLHGARTLRIT